MTVAGLTATPSAHSVRETIDRLAARVATKGMAVFAPIDDGGADGGDRTAVEGADLAGRRGAGQE